jgi:hypothetical protein
MWQLLVPPVAGPHGPGPRFPVMEPLNKLVWSGKGGVRPTLGEQNDLVAGDCPNRWFRRGQAIGGGVYSLQRTSVPRQANRAGAQLQSHRGDPLRFGGRPTLMGPQGGSRRRHHLTASTWVASGARSSSACVFVLVRARGGASERTIRDDGG